MESYTNFSFSPVLFDPATKLHKLKGYRFRNSDWNEYQKMEQHNPLIDVNRYPIRINYNKENLVRLAGVKTGIYNPVLPTLRKTDRDDVLCKLSDEHARHTTFLRRKDLLSSSTPYLTTAQRGAHLIENQFYPYDEYDGENDDQDHERYYRDESEKIRKNSRIISSLPLSRRTTLIRLGNPDFAFNYQRPFSAATHDGMNQFDDIRNSYKVYRKHVLSAKQLVN